MRLIAESDIKEILLMTRDEYDTCPISYLDIMYKDGYSVEHKCDDVVMLIK